MPLDDQVTMLVGVSVRHAVELEATLRSLLITLDPSFDSSRRWQFSQLVSTFRRLARTHPTFTSDARRACTVIATEVQAAYNHRSSNVHDMLGSYGDTSIERFRFERDTKIEYRDDPEVRSVDDLVQICTDLMHATWRLRGVIFYLQRPAEPQHWSMLLGGVFTARWNGSASHVR